MANLKKLKFAIRILLRAGIAAAALTFAGCEGPLGYDASAAGYASMANNPQISAQQRSAAALMSGLMSREGQRVHEMNVAEAGRSQVTINNNTSQPSSSGSSIGKIWNAVDHKMDDGSTYTGPLIAGSDGMSRPHGRGVITWPNGDKYEGQVENGKYNGRGVLTLPKGWKYDGEYKDNQMHGRGVATWANGQRYQGHFENGKYNGRGVLTFPDGRQYDGEWKDGDEHGQGRFTKPNGDAASGEWRDGKPWRIKGTDVWPDGTKYVGEWNHDGSKSGGTITWMDGRIYEGDWKVLEGKPDLPDGQGTLTWPDGRKYTGDFREGKMQGFGKMTYPDGKVEEGAWRDNKFIGGGTPGSSSSSKTGFVSVSADDQTFEVFADGAFVGNTPAKLKLSEGTHVIEVKKAGYKDYKKEIKITEGCELNLRAVLEKG
jgi:hypothetical protein